MTTTRPQLKISLLIVAALAALVAAVYWRVPGYGFVEYDDDAYVYAHVHVLAGLNAKSVLWAFTTDYASNWHPLTWLSLMADAELTKYLYLPDVHDKPNARIFHLTNIGLHLANTLLLYLLLLQTTGYAWRSAFVAALFAAHPLHVESVAWIAERKDVLSTLFWMLTTLAYVSWTSRGGRGRYALVIALYALGLTSKPMLVSLPIVLLAMDYWPLGRLRVAGYRGRGTKDKRGTQHPTRDTRPLSSLIVEKLPLFALALASCVITYYVQQKSGAIGTLDQLTFTQRTANAVVSYATYVVKMVVPTGLAAFYPHPRDTLPTWQVICSGIWLAGMCGAAWLLRRSRPYMAVGWLWYVITLVPVIGLVQVGRQGWADRYSYVPLIGLFVAIAWTAAELVPQIPAPKRSKEPPKPKWGLATCGAAVVLAFAVGARVQTQYWKDSMSLFTRMLQVTKRNYLAHSQLGNALAAEGRTDEAIAHYRESISLNPDFADAYFNLGVALDNSGQTTEAIKLFRQAARLLPREAAVRNNLGCALAKIGDASGAEKQFRIAARLDPKDPQAPNNLGSLFAQRGDLDQAIRQFKRAVELDPNDERIRANLERAIALRDSRLR